MFRRLLFSVVFCMVLPAQAAPTRSSGALPLTRLRIYEAGIAYFEREGHVPQSRKVELPLPAGHLDDALKTLVLFDPEKNAEVSGVEFESSVTRERASALAGLSSNQDKPLNFKALTESLRGQDVVLEVAGQQVRGQVVDVIAPKDSSLKRCLPTDPQHPTECVFVAQDTVTVATRAGALRRFALDEVQSIAPVDSQQRQLLRSALRTLSGSRAATAHTLRLDAQAGSRVALGYLGEAPLWRASYRLLLASDQSATLQAWVLLHNDSNEDWRDLHVELVNGRPDSFLFPLAAPRYATRRLVTPEQRLSSVPQLLGREVDDIWDKDDTWADELGESFGAGGMGLSGVGAGGGGVGEGTGLSDETDLLSVGNLAAAHPTTGVEKGALFLYSIEAPISLKAHHSTLVPFLTEPLSATRFVLFQHAGELGQSVLSIENSGNTTLPSGPAAIFEADGLAGESLLMRLKPGQRQLLSFGTDLDFEIEELTRDSSEHVRKVGFFQGKLDVHYIKRQKLTLELTNRAGSQRHALLALNLVNNAKVSGADVYFDAATKSAYAKLTAKARATGKVTLTLEEGLRRQLALEDLSIWRLNQYASSQALSTQTRRTLAQAARALDESYERVFRVARLRAGLASVKQQSQRLQGMIGSLTRSHRESVEPLMKRLLHSERITELTETEIRRLEAIDRWASLRQVLAHLPNTR